MSKERVLVLSLVIVLSALVARPAAGGELYKWVDDNGVIHFADSLEGVPPSLRDKTKPTPVYEQDEVPAAASHEEIRGDRTVPNEEAIDRLLRRLWKDYRDCLKRGDIEKALTYLHPSARGRYRQMFEVLKDRFPEMTKDELPLNKKSIEEGNAVYELVRKEKGGLYSHEVIFAFDAGGNWKIARE